MRNGAILFFTLLSLQAMAQELFVNAEPASNIPAHAVSVNLSAFYVPFDRVYDRPGQRYVAQAMYGVSPKLMVRAGLSFSDMHTSSFQRESVFLVGKFRFVSKDGLHKHFRMAAFLGAAHTRAPFHFDEAGMYGDKSGIEGGIIATRLVKRFAISGTVSHMQLLDKSRFDKVVYLPERNYSLMNYSMSAGYLAAPKVYRDYRQVNLNIYMEMIAQQALKSGTFYLDIAPSAQLIFFSSLKLNVGYRFQLTSDMDRMAANSWRAGVENTFFNVTNKKQKSVKGSTY